MTIDEILVAVKAEFDRSVAKHGDWAGYSEERMIRTVLDEMSELVNARLAGDVNGPHGMLAEAIQAAACLCKLVMQMERRQVATGEGTP